MQLGPRATGGRPNERSESLAWPSVPHARSRQGKHGVRGADRNRLQTAPCALRFEGVQQFGPYPRGSASANAGKPCRAQNSGAGPHSTHCARHSARSSELIWRVVLHAALRRACSRGCRGCCGLRVCRGCER